MIDLADALDDMVDYRGKKEKQWKTLLRLNTCLKPLER